VNLERALDRPHVHSFHLAQRHIEFQLQIGRAAGAEAMTVRAVGVQIRARPQIQVGVSVVRIRQMLRRRLVEGYLRTALILVQKPDNARMLEGAKLVIHNAAVVMVLV